MSREWDYIQTTYTFRLLKEYRIRNFFETGTFEGNTSLFFNDLGFNVYTAENNHERVELCRKKFRGTDIELYEGDSVEYLRQFLTRDVSDVFYYLDAHERGDKIPLKQELQLLFTQPKFLAMVHDVSVPNQPQFTHGQDVSDGFHSTEIPNDVVRIYPKYITTPNPYLKTRTVGYCILTKGYPIVCDGNFTIICKGCES